MNVKTNSWHFQFYKTSFGFAYMVRDTTNLCSYFWRVVGGILYRTLQVLAVIVPLTVLGVLFYHFTGVMSSIFGIIACGVGMLYISCKMYDRREERRLESGYYNQPPKEPGLIRSFLKAKKDKVCPIITIERA